MIIVERTRTIEAPIEAVWAVLADFDRLAEWADNADHTSWMHPPQSDDDMIGRARRVQAGRMVLIETITAWDPPHRLQYDLAGLPPIVRRAANEWLLTADDGRTAVALRSHVDAGPRPPQQVIARAVGRRLAGASDTMLAGLADRLTSASPSPSPATDQKEST